MMENRMALGEGAGATLLGVGGWQLINEAKVQALGKQPPLESPPRAREMAIYDNCIA